MILYFLSRNRNDISCIAQDVVGGGSQCTCCALLFLCVESNHSDNHWDSAAINNVIQAGTEMHSQIIVSRGEGSSYLMITELPNCVIFNGTTYISKPLAAYSGLLGTEKSEISSLTYCLRDAVNAVFSVNCFALLSLGSANSAFTSAICKSKSSDEYKCFDSHSRSAAGIFSPGGKSVLLSVQSVDGLISYIVALSKSLFGSERHPSVSFELTPVICEPQTRIFSVGSASTDHKCDISTAVGVIPSAQDDCISAVTGMPDNIDSSDCSVAKTYRNSDGKSDTDLCPNVCSREQFRNWQATRSWLCAIRLINAPSLIGVTCSACSEIGSLTNCKSLESTKERLSVSSEWLCGITASNSKKLHDKMTQHASSKAHKLCVAELKSRASEKLEKSLQKSKELWRAQNVTRINETSRVFRTVYVIAWKHLSFRSHPYLCDLQKQNGVTLGNILYSHQTCSRIAQFIATEMRQRLLTYVISSESLFSLMMDESTTMANETALIVYLRASDPSGNKQL